ncbi:MAG: M24 family metallopeptidase, partial [Chloroflexi bacterium]|nr:M24 family metallopeptidase [Chloroflexota bacterium]
MGERLNRAVAAVAESGLDGWLLYDFRHSNPLLWEMTESDLHSTRRVYLWLPRGGRPTALVHHVDAAHFGVWGVDVRPYRDRDDLVARLSALLTGAQRVAMEYSPMGALPTLSWVDGGTLDLVRSFGVEVVSSGDLAQAALSRLSAWNLQSHRYAAQKLTEIVHEAFAWIGEKVREGVDEHTAAEFIRMRFVQEGLVTDSGPIVAVNAHAGDPHYEPTSESALPIRPGDWVLIDLWAKQEGGIFADITWTGFVGEEIPEEYLKVFRTVTVARDIALDFIRFTRGQGRNPQGWEVDKAARDYITM